MTLVNFHELLLRTCHFKFCTISELVQDGFINSFKPTVRFPLTRALDKSRHCRNKFSDVPRFEPRAAGWQVKSRVKGKMLLFYQAKISIDTVSMHFVPCQVTQDLHVCCCVLFVASLKCTDLFSIVQCQNARFQCQLSRKQKSWPEGSILSLESDRPRSPWNQFLLPRGWEVHQGILRNVILTLYPARPFRSVWELLFLPGVVGVHRHPSMAELFLT